jgi:hypothetical protein
MIEDDSYAILRRALAVRNAIAHGFLNQPIDQRMFKQLRDAARDLLGHNKAGSSASTRASSRPRSRPSAA